MLAPDLIGYGSSAPWPADKPFKAEADLDVLTAIAKKSRGALHLVGHSYGAALALETTRRLGNRMKSLTLVEPVSFHLLRQERRPEWGEVEQLGKAVLGGVANGDDRAAAAAFMSYWLGRWRWRLSPERFKRNRRDDSQGRARIPDHRRGANYAQRLRISHRSHAFDQRQQDTRAHPCCGRSPRRSFAECEGRDAKGRGPYEPVHPSRRAQPVDTRSPRHSAVTFTPSPSPSSSTSRANSSSSSFAWVMALARTFSRSV